jgi:hypothetical protein
MKLSELLKAKFKHTDFLIDNGNDEPSLVENLIDEAQEAEENGYQFEYIVVTKEVCGETLKNVHRINAEGYVESQAYYRWAGQGVKLSNGQYAAVNDLEELYDIVLLNRHDNSSFLPKFGTLPERYQGNDKIISWDNNNIILYDDNMIELLTYTEYENEYHHECFHLQNLLQKMKLGNKGLDFSDLPKFAEKPEWLTNTQFVWSWDNINAIVGFDWEDFRIVPLKVLQEKIAIQK